MSRQLRILAVMSALTLVWSSPGEAQGWEIGLGGVQVQLTEREASPFGGSQIPTGLALSARRIVGSRGPFLELLWSGAWQTRDGSVCHGLVGSEGCPVEPVAYSGGTTFVSAGWTLPIDLSDRLRLRVTPSMGVGVLRAKERGVVSGREAGDIQPSLRIGGEVQALWQFGGGRYVALGLSRHESLSRKPDCADCADLIGERAGQTGITLSLGWFG